MTSNQIREKYIKFFEERGHKKIDPAPLVLKDDPTTLFISAGMQPLVPFLKGKSHPKGKRLVNSQPSIRTQDIEEVGDNRHTTFFEMLGNWSLGDYFKKEQLNWCWEFFTKELGLPKERLWVSVFKGTKEVPKDEESFKIWKEIGVPEKKIHHYGVKENWWSMVGTPDKMPPGEIGGPDSEVFFEFTQVKHDPKFGKDCHPNCECGRFLEIGNSVFIQYEVQEDGSLKELPQKSVDFGGGLERLVSATNNNPDIFEIDVFRPVIKKIEEVSEKTYKGNEKSMRIIADHMRAASLIVEDGVIPDNKQHGYVLRRLIRRSAIKLRELKGDFHSSDLSFDFAKSTNKVIGEEMNRFSKSLERGLKQIEKIEKIDANKAFDLFQTHGFPVEITEELFAEKGQKIDKKKFEKEFEKHRELSRSASVGMFKGGLADKSKNTIKLHTATHLLHWALRKVLGESVRQEGSNITSERLRFDFSFERKLTEDEKKKVESLINEKIDEELPVHKTLEDKTKALESGAMAFFRETYPDKVSIYTIGKDSKDDFVSKEFCGGPHVENTSEIGRVRIEKQKKIGSNLIRVYAVIV